MPYSEGALWKGQKGIDKEAQFQFVGCFVAQPPPHTPDAKQFVKRFEQALAEHLPNFRRVIDEFGQVRASEDREHGKEFGLRDHVRGLVLSLLSNQRPWGPIQDNLRRIESIFLEFDSDALIRANPDHLVTQLRDIRCGNRQIKKQMATLANNLAVFSRIVQDQSSLDCFVTSDEPHRIAEALSRPERKYKLQQVGYTLAMEYLRNVGIRASKPDVHVRRIIGSGRLGFAASAEPTEIDAYRIVGKIADDAVVNATYLDNILWLFCAKDYANVCGATPQCAVCGLRSICSYPTPAPSE